MTRQHPGPWLPLHRGPRPPTRGVFLSRPHRFAARCELPGGEIIEAHLPDPGRLARTATPGRPVLLDGPLDDPRRTLQWTCLAMREPTAWVGTVTTAVNRMIPGLLDAGWLPELGRPSSLRPEVKRGRSRFDWKLGYDDAPPCWLECKSATLARGRTVSFPDSVTTRGTRHLEELAAMAADKERCAVVFLAQRADVHRFEPATSIDPAFGLALQKASGAGVSIAAVALQVGPRGLRAHRRLELRLP